MLRLVVVANARIYREGLARRLGEREDFEVVATVAGLEESLPWARADADVVLVDMATPRSLAIVERLHLESSTARIIAIGVPELEDVILQCAEAGISGYLPLEGSLEELVRLIKSVSRGESLVSPRIAAGLLRRVSTLADRQASGAVALPLTRRERQIADLLEQGLTNKEISRRLDIRVATVKNHVHNILKKLHLQHRAEVGARLRRRQEARRIAGLPPAREPSLTVREVVG